MATSSPAMITPPRVRRRPAVTPDSGPFLSEQRRVDSVCQISFDFAVGLRDGVLERD